MIEHPHVDQRQGVFQPLGQLTVGLARLGHARRVVVGEDHRRRVLRQGTLDHLPRVDAGAIDGAVEQHFEGQDPVLGVEKQAAEQLVRFVAQARLEVIAYRLRRFQCRIAAQPFGQVPAPHLQHGL